MIICFTRTGKFEVQQTLIMLHFTFWVKWLHELKIELAACNRKPEIVVYKVGEIYCSVTWKRSNCNQYVTGRARPWSSGREEPSIYCGSFHPQCSSWSSMAVGAPASLQVRGGRNPAEWKEYMSKINQFPLNSLFTNPKELFCLLSLVVDYVKIT